MNRAGDDRLPRLREAAIRLLVVGAAGAAALAYAVRGLPPVAPPAASPGPTVYVVEMVDSAFVPETLTVPAGAPVVLELRNRGRLLHDFSSAALRLGEEARPGETRRLELTAPAGDHEVYCSVPGHKAAGMTMTLRATGGGSA